MKTCSPPLVVAYATEPEPCAPAAVEPMFTMRPPGCRPASMPSRITGATAALQMKVPVRLTASTAFQSSRGVLEDAAATVQPGVVHEHIDASPALEHALDNARDVVGVGDRGEGGHEAVGLARLALGVLADEPLVDVEHAHRVARLEEPFGGREAEAARRAGDHPQRGGLRRWSSWFPSWRVGR